MISRAPAFISRMCLTAAGLDTPSQIVFLSFCSSAKEYAEGSVFNKYQVIAPTSVNHVPATEETSVSPGVRSARSRFHSEVNRKSFARPSRRSSVQRDSADRSRCTFIREWNVAARQAFLHRHCRHNRNTQSRAHHAQNAAELTAFKNNPWVQARSFAGGECRIAEGMPVTQ